MRRRSVIYKEVKCSVLSITNQKASVFKYIRIHCLDSIEAKFIKTP